MFNTSSISPGEKRAQAALAVDSSEKSIPLPKVKFSAKEFISMVNKGQFTEALASLQPDGKECSALAIMAIGAIEPKTGETLLHQLAQSAVLNDALLEEKESAQKVAARSVLHAVKLLSPMHIQQRSNKRTAFAEAVYCNHRAISDVLYDKKCLGVADSEGNTPLHYAIKHCHCDLIARILANDAKYELYFKPNNQGLFSLAFALKQYKEHPAAVSLSVVNQLYFTLPKGEYRTRVLETEVNVTWSLFKRPLWREILRMAGKRNAKHEVETIDLNLWDFIVQGVNDGVWVWGFRVDLDLIYEYSDSYADTPGKMLSVADSVRMVGLPGRTLAQTAVNTTLAKNREFTQRLNLEQAKYQLAYANANPAESKELGRLYAHNKDWIILFEDKLFYVPQRFETKPANCTEIKKDGRRDKDQAAYDALKSNISKMKLAEHRPAQPDEIRNIMPLIPLLNDPLSDETPLIPIQQHHHRVGVGMTLFATTVLPPAAVPVTAPPAVAPVATAPDDATQTAASDSNRGLTS